MVKKAEKGEVINQAVLSYCGYIFLKSMNFIFMTESSQECSVKSTQRTQKKKPF